VPPNIGDVHAKFGRNPSIGSGDTAFTTRTDARTDNPKTSPFGAIATEWTKNVLIVGIITTVYS